MSDYYNEDDNFVIDNIADDPVIPDSVSPQAFFITHKSFTLGFAGFPVWQPRLQDNQGSLTATFYLSF